MAFLCGAVPAGIIGVVHTTSVLLLCMVVVLIVMYDFYYWNCAGTVCYNSCFIYIYVIVCVCVFILSSLEGLYYRYCW